MTDTDKAVQTQLANIEKRTGKSIQELMVLVGNCGLTKHGERVAFLKSRLGMGHGDANMLVHVFRQQQEPSEVKAKTDEDNPLGSFYQGGKAHLQPIHETILDSMKALGNFETAPKKTYVSYRRKKQFVMIGPATNSRVEVGLNVRGLKPDARLEQLPAGKMCQYKVKLTDPAQVDEQLLGWIQAAYDSAG